MAVWQTGSGIQGLTVLRWKRIKTSSFKFGFLYFFNNGVSESIFLLAQRVFPRSVRVCQIAKSVDVVY